MWPRSNKGSVVNEDPLKDVDDYSDTSDDDIIRKAGGEY